MKVTLSRPRTTQTRQKKPVTIFNVALDDRVYLIGFRVMDGCLFPPSMPVGTSGRYRPILGMSEEVAERVYWAVTNSGWEVDLRAVKTAVRPLVVDEVELLKIMGE